MKKVSIIGLGYVGLPLACVIAKSEAYQTCGFDISQKRIDDLSNGFVPFNDSLVCEILPNLKIIRFSNESHGGKYADRFFVGDKVDILNDSDIFVICVPTPVHRDHTPDLEPVCSASQSIVPFLKSGALVILESTVNPGVCEEVVIPILESDGLKCGKDFFFAYCPERINPGDETWNVLNIPRNLGGYDETSLNLAYDFYKSFITAPINKVSNLKVAEASKIVENTFRDINIAFVNELAQSFDVMGIDTVEVLQSASNKPFAFMPHWPGCGVGGHCIPVDPYYLIRRADEAGFDHKFLKIAREINNSMPEYAVTLLDKMIKDLSAKKGESFVPKIGLYGLSYKKDIGDTRESPAFEIRELLKKRYGKDNLIVYDPFVAELSSFSSFDEFLENINILFVATNHSQIVSLPVSEFVKFGIDCVLDGRNCLAGKEIIKRGVLYKGIGR